LTLKIVRDGLTWLVVLWQIAYVRLVWGRLPARLPSHFGWDGQPNRYAGRGIVWVLVGVSALVCVLLTVLERFPRVFNLPAPRGSADRPRQEALAVQMLGWLRLETALTIAYLLWTIVRLAMQQRVGLGVAFTILPVAAILLTVLGFVVRMVRGGDDAAKVRV
jgi:uncharacterized membrane protein